ncbi:MAG: hypothetical protein ABIK09_05545 [Pseudomonadota bacterium]
MPMTHPATARWIVVLMLVLGACRGGDAVDETDDGEKAAPDLEVPALPDFGPMGDLQPEAGGEAWATGVGFKDREEYRVRLIQTAHSEVPGRAPMEHRVRQEFTLVREVISRDAGLTRLMLRIQDVTFTPLGPDGEPTPTPPQMASFAPTLERVEVHLAMDERGRIQELEVAKASNLPRGMEDLFHQLVRDLQVTLPPDAASPGTSWVDAGELPVEREKSRNIVRWSLAGTYRGTVDRSGVRCAMVEIEGKLEEEGWVDRKEIRGTVEGRGRVRKVALMEADTGRLVELRMVSALARRVTYGKESREKARIEELTMELSLQAGTADEENQ